MATFTKVDSDLSAWALVRRVQAGETEAFGEIYTRYVRKVYIYIHRSTGNRQTAEDLTSETFFRALNRVHTFTCQGRDFSAVLITIARNLVTDHFHGRQNQRRLAVRLAMRLDVNGADRAAEGRPEESAVDHVDNMGALVALGVPAALAGLTSEQRDVIVLRFLRDLSIAETAEVMAKTQSAVKGHQLRALRVLRALPRTVTEGVHR